MSERRDKTEEADAPRRLSYLSDVGSGLRRTFTDAWMVTFTDLIALMLTFFVLLFSMSTVERYKWQSLVRSLAGSMDSIQTREGAKPAVEFQIDQDAPLPGTDLDYLTPVIERQIASEPALSAGMVWRAPGRTVLSFPAGALFQDDTGTIAAQARPAVYAISRLIQTLGNLIEVHGHAAGGTGDPQGASWVTSLARARAVAESLTELGYRGPVVARGYAASRSHEPGPPSRPGDPAGRAERVDIVIYEVAPRGS